MIRNHIHAIMFVTHVVKFIHIQKRTGFNAKLAIVFYVVPSVLIYIKSKL